MTVIDIRTFFTGYVLSILLCVIVMTSLWWQNRKRSPEIVFWLADYVLQFIGLLLITFRGILPDLLTIFLANLFIIGGTVVLYIGLGRYVGKESRQLHNYLMLAVFTLAHAYLTYVYPDIELRLVNLSLALIYICAQCSWLMLRRVDAGLRPATRATGIVFAAFCLVSFVQIVVNLTIPKTYNIFVSGFFGVVAILMYQILFIALTFSLFLLVSRRLSMALESELYQCAQAEDELRQSEEKFAKAFQTSPYAIAITRMKDGKFIEINDAFATITGYSHAEVMAESSIGLKLWVNEEDRKEMVSILRKGLPVTGREFLFRRKNGEVLTGLFSAHTIQLSQEPCILSSIDDITERKQSERAFKETRDYLDNLITHANAPIITWNSDFIITRFNHAFEHLSKMKANDVLGKKLEILFPQESKEESISKIRMALAGEFWKSVEIPILRKDGTVRIVLWNSANIYGADGKTLVSIIAQGYDITERKQVEELTRVRLSLLDFAITHSLEEMLQKTLDEVGALVESPIGFYHFVEKDQKTLSLQAWSTRTIKEFCKAEGKGMHYGIDQAGVWVDCVREKRPVIHNDYNSLPHRKGLPEGHAAVIRELVVPIMRGGSIMAILGVGNKPVNYTEKDIEIVSYLADEAWEITRRKQAEEALRKSEERFKQLAEVFPETIFETDIKGDITYANKHGLNYFGYTEEDIANGVNISNIVSPDDRNLVLERIQERMQGIEKRYLEYRALRKDGSTFYALASSAPIMVDGMQAGIRGFILDITERKQAEEQIKHLATHDLLTDLPSLRLARDRLSSALNMAHRYKKAAAVMFIDLDGFKAVNDTFGHDVGDYVLQQVAQRLLSCVRETDTVARVGGDEFLIIATEINTPENVAQIAEKVIHLVSQPFSFKGQQAVVGASIGIALFPDHGKDMDELIKQADKAMYRVKNAGKNGFSFVNSALI